MPLRFSDLQMFGYNYTPQMNSPAPRPWLNEVQQRKWQAAQNDIEREAEMKAQQSKLDSAIQLKQMDNDAAKGSKDTEAKRKFMERAAEAYRSGDNSQIDAVASEAPQYGLSFEREKADQRMVPNMAGGIDPVSLPAKDKYIVRDAASGEAEAVFDMDAMRNTNKEIATKVYGAAGKNARKQDQAAHKQAFEIARNSGMPIDALMKTAPIDSVTDRLNRESRELGQQMNLAEQRLYHRESIDLRRDDQAADAARDAELMALRREGEARRRAESELREGRTDRIHEDRMYRQAMKTGASPTIAIEEKNKILHGAIKMQAMLDEVTSVPGATPGKAQIAAVRQYGIMMQDGYNRLTDADARAAEDSWGVVNSVVNKITKGFGEGLSDQELKDFDEAIARIVVVTDEQRKNAFNAMAGSLPRNDRIGMEQYGRYINTQFGDADWFEDAAKEAGVPLFSGTATPEREPESSQAPAAVSDDEAMKLLEEEGF